MIMAIRPFAKGKLWSLKENVRTGWMNACYSSWNWGIFNTVESNLLQTMMAPSLPSSVPVMDPGLGSVASDYERDDAFGHFSSMLVKVLSNPQLLWRNPKSKIRTFTQTKI
jgi:hypothetical protein